MRSPLERIALIMDVAECDFERACRLLRLDPGMIQAEHSQKLLDALKKRLRDMTADEFAEFSHGRVPPPKQNNGHVVSQQEICAKLRQLSDEEFRWIGLLGLPSRFL
jgi:hypothetical protein